MRTTCEQCGLHLVKSKPWQKVHNKCAVEYDRRIRRERWKQLHPPRYVPCKLCGQPVKRTTNETTHRECRAEWRRKRFRLWQRSVKSWEKPASIESRKRWERNNRPRLALKARRYRLLKGAEHLKLRRAWWSKNAPNLNAARRIQIAELDKSYVLSTLARSLRYNGAAVTRKNIPDALVSLYRDILKIKRLIKTKTTTIT